VTTHKPVLDEQTFQQLLAAAYALQEQNLAPLKETKAIALALSASVEAM
jgi:hypothetical protein